VNSIIFVLVIMFTNQTGDIGVAWDRNPHLTKESCEAKVDHLRQTTPKNWQHVGFECKPYPAPVYNIDETSPKLTPNT
jgi:hypothetical protein